MVGALGHPPSCEVAAQVRPAKACLNHRPLSVQESASAWCKPFWQMETQPRCFVSPFFFFFFFPIFFPSVPSWSLLVQDGLASKKRQLVYKYTRSMNKGSKPYYDVILAHLRQIMYRSFPLAVVRRGSGSTRYLTILLLSCSIMHLFLSPSVDAPRTSTGSTRSTGVRRWQSHRERGLLGRQPCQT